MMQRLTNWGGFPYKNCQVFIPENYESVVQLVQQHQAIIARGNGRCYGDASLAPVVLQSDHLNQILFFDQQNGIIQCQSGVLLSTILERIVPHGFFLPVSPGTKFITVGGAFASDIHGKNHHKEGVFSDHVLSIQLVDAYGDIKEVQYGEDLFFQTAGGMGRTGFILELTFRLKKIETSFIRQSSIRAKNLLEIFSLFEQYQDATYSVAWIDCLAKGDEIGKSVLLIGEHALSHEVKKTDPLKVHAQPSWRVPFFFPSWFLHPIFIRIFNKLYYSRPSANKKDQLVHYDSFFYPLDAVHHWNKIYGKRGFVQYQFVVPMDVSYPVIQQVLTILAAHEMGSFLAVLKLFGDAHEHRYLHFPMKGYTLALDIPITEKLWGVLDELDEIVTKAGGKIYLTKDARLKKKHFEKQYQQLFHQEHSFQSYQMSRLQQDQQNVFLILGASSDMALEAASLYLNQYKDAHLILASRNTSQLESFVQEKGIASRATIQYFDAVDIHSHQTFIASLKHKPRWVLYASGLLVENDVAQKGMDDWKNAVHVNYLGAVSVIETLLMHENGSDLERVIGISSIAGLRGRKANYMYGSTKAAFYTYLFGLRQSLRERGIVVQAVTPGFVVTKMTAHLSVPGNAVSAKKVGESIVKYTHKRFEIYPNLYWRIIGQLVKILPEFMIAKI